MERACDTQIHNMAILFRSLPPGALHRWEVSSTSLLDLVMQLNHISQPVWMPVWSLLCIPRVQRTYGLMEGFLNPGTVDSVSLHIGFPPIDHKKAILFPVLMHYLDSWTAILFGIKFNIHCVFSAFSQCRTASARTIC
jgi:hypothetical protein